MEKDFFVVDFEFTQYTKPIGKPRAFFSEIIEIGAVRIDGETYEITGYIEDFVKPHFFPKHATESMEFCMITASDMENAIDFSDMIKQIESLYTPGKTYFVAWGDADYKVIKQSCERHMLPNPISQEDCLDLAKACKMIRGERKTPGLHMIVEEMNLSNEGFGHTAYDDAVNTGKVLLKLIADGWKPEHYFKQLEEPNR